MESVKKSINLFPVFSQLHDDSQAQASPRGEIPETLRVGFSRVMAFAKPKRRRARKKQPPAERAIGSIPYEQETRRDTQRAIHAVAYLLKWASESSNQPIDGESAAGLSSLLRKAADDVGLLFTIAELRGSGGDPGEVRP